MSCRTRHERTDEQPLGNNKLIKGKGQIKLLAHVSFHRVKVVQNTCRLDPQLRVHLGNQLVRLKWPSIWAEFVRFWADFRHVRGTLCGRVHPKSENLP